MSHALKALGCLAGFLAVLFAAAGAHLGLGEAEARMLASVTMLLGFHAPALIAVALWGAWRGGLLLGLGLGLFSLAVLLRVFAGISLGPVAPIGGFAMMGGWLWLGVMALRRR
ncbi:DUF423 domain-containing protein [Rhodovarius sp.]|uniref:DUF423 domain-containing protein n=1 Tax=Rhodovarius sp. TaxID=2972673 RepID=UPI00333F300F